MLFNKNTLRLIAAILVVMTIACALVPVNAQAAQTPIVTVDESANAIVIENHDTWALIVDASGSMAHLDQQIENAISRWFGNVKFDFQATFDTELHPWEMDYRSHRDTDIAGAVEETVEVYGHNRVVVVTDGRQDPVDYSDLTDKTGIDLHIVLLGDELEAADELIGVCKGRLLDDSSLTVYKDNTEVEVQKGYQSPMTVIPYPDNTEEVMALEEQIALLEEEVASMEATYAENTKNMEAMVVSFIERNNYEPLVYGIFVVGVVILMSFAMFWGWLFTKADYRYKVEMRKAQAQEYCAQVESDAIKSAASTEANGRRSAAQMLVQAIEACFASSTNKFNNR